MTKKLLLRGLLGIFIGLAIGYVITIALSLTAETQQYMPCAPGFAEAVGSETGAVALQAVLCALIGFVCGAGSLVWEIERWGLMRQTAAYFGIAAVTILPVAYVLRWMDGSAMGILIYFAIFVAIFACVFLIQFFLARRAIRKLNSELQRRQAEER